MNTSALHKDPITPGCCEWCGKDCPVEQPCCSMSCLAQLHRLEAVQGRMVLRELKAWRKHRGRKDTPGEGVMTAITALVDGFLKTDRLRREAAAAQRRAGTDGPKEPKKTSARVETAAPVDTPPEEPEAEPLRKPSFKPDPLFAEMPRDPA